MDGITREQLEEEIGRRENDWEPEILKILDEVCAGVFITNRQRLEIVKKLSIWAADVWQNGRES